MIDLEKSQYKPVGYCIFCGSTEELTREHIIPFGLGGASTLPKASCKTCAGKTGRIEQDVLRGPLWPIRVFRDLKSRTKHRDAPNTIAVTIERHGEETELELPLDQAPIIFQFPLFAEPGYFRPNSYQKGIDIQGVATVGFGETIQEILNRLDATRVSIPQRYKPASFARFIAKIAYCTAFAEGAFSLINETCPLVVSAILGDSNDIGRYIGNVDDGGITKEGLLHYTSLHADSEQGLLLSRVHLFADSQSPQYAVVLGSLVPNVERIT